MPLLIVALKVFKRPKLKEFIYSMIGFFGFKSLNAIVEDLKENLHRTQVANDKKAAVVKEHSTGFSTVAADAAELAARFEPKAMDQSSVVDLF